MTNITLNDCRKGDRGAIKGIAQTEKAYRRKLLAMGLTPGTKFTVQRVAPLGDPIEISVRGFQLSLRKREAKAIQVKKDCPCQI